MRRAQSNRIHKGYQDQQKAFLYDLETGLNEILIRPEHRNNKYFTLMPLVDKNHYFYWVVNFFDDSGYGKHSSGEIRVYECEQPNFSSSSPFLHYEIHSNMIKIIDFNTATFRNRGIGTKMLNILEQMAISLNIDYISGYLAPADYEDRDAQIRFYKRNGYTVNSNDQTRKGNIRKILKN
jgi:GNAT superfamily N-acetyltransferase